MSKVLASFCAVFSLLFALSVAAADLSCSVCGMSIPEYSKNHFVLHHGKGKGKAEHKTSHACSLGCVKKAFKNIPEIQSLEVSDFENPTTLIPADQANFILGSKKIKSDLGEMVMPPYFGAFSDKSKAEKAQAKYNDGRVVQGLVEVLK